MIRILAIGNSFSQDATHYLQQIAAADGVEMKVANLYIGGCELKRHFENIQNEAKDYLLEINGVSTDSYVSVQDALAMESWDYIVTQQASHDSGLIETYEPYLGEMVAFLQKKQPQAEILLQETWAYEIDSLHNCFGRYHHDQQEMYEKLSKAYKEEAAKYGLRYFPSGDVIQVLRGEDPFRYGHGGMSICRDGFHMNLIYGRYLLSAIWYRTLTGRSVKDNVYIPSTPLAPGAICDEAVLDRVKEIVDENVPFVSDQNGSRGEQHP